MTKWRVGRQLGRTLYRDDVCVGMVDTPELASEIVEAMNRRAIPAEQREAAGLCTMCGHPNAYHARSGCVGTEGEPCVKCGAAPAEQVSAPPLAVVGQRTARLRDDADLVSDVKHWGPPGTREADAKAILDAVEAHLADRQARAVPGTEPAERAEQPEWPSLSIPCPSCGAKTGEKCDFSKSPFAKVMLNGRPWAMADSYVHLGRASATPATATAPPLVAAAGQRTAREVVRAAFEEAGATTGTTLFIAMVAMLEADRHARAVPGTPKGGTQG